MPLIQGWCTCVKIMTWWKQKTEWEGSQSMKFYHKYWNQHLDIAKKILFVCCLGLLIALLVSNLIPCKILLNIPVKYPSFFSHVTHYMIFNWAESKSLCSWQTQRIRFIRQPLDILRLTLIQLRDTNDTERKAENSIWACFWLNDTRESVSISFLMWH